MMNPPGTSSFPGYYSTVPPRPPDIDDFANIDVKGEYIEEFDDIKEETEDRQTPAPVAAPPVPFLPSQYSPYRGVSVSQGCPPLMPRMPPLTPSTFQPNLSPLQLIQKLSNYANNSRKRVSPMSSMQTPLTSATSQSYQCPPVPAKRFQSSFQHQNQNSSFQPRIDKVMSLQATQGHPGVVSPPRQKETNNNSSSKESDSPPDVPDMTGQSTKSMIDCPVCGDIAVAHFHYGGMCCYSCKAFFRRVVNTNKATKYKCRAGNNQCDVSLANRRSCQACRYKKCVAAGMKPGLVLSDDQCHKKFGPKKGAKEDRHQKPAAKVKDDTEEDVDDPVDEPQEQDEMADEDYSVLIDQNKSLAEQNRLGRQLFISIFSTGSVSSGQITDEELEMFKNIDNNNSMATSFLTERQVQNSRKFLSFFQQDRNVFLPNGFINISDVIHTLIEQSVLVLKQNQDFKTLSVKDQTELLESNAMVVSLITMLQLYNAQNHTISWTLSESDYQSLRKLNMKTVNGRAVFGLPEVQARVEADIRDDMVKLFKFFDYFSLIAVPKNALFVLAVAVVFSHDCCDIENKVKIEQMRRRYLIILFECVSQSEGVLGACKIALKLHSAIHHLNRICQLFAQKFVTVQE